MKKILLDTNILLDIALKREPHFADSAALFKKLDEKKILAYITATTITDIYYISKKAKDHSTAIQFISNLLQIVDILGVNKEVVLLSLQSDLPDFEDAIQINSAELNGIKTINTRNKKDFKNVKQKIETPRRVFGGTQIIFGNQLTLIS